jgi:peptidoglycan/LPS O-acetylase OafA/YrhL
MFFFEKKNQKTFGRAVADLSPAPTKRHKSFLLLFFKKEGLFLRSSRPSGRIAALDGLRGVLAAVVVADHAAMDFGSESLGHAANIAVTIFFILSGMVLTRQWDGRYLPFLASRFVRLWPVFALCLAWGYARAGMRPEILEFFWIPVPRYDANSICPPMWSLFIEAWASLAMPAIVWTARGGVFRSLACVAAGIVVACLWWPQNAALRAFECYSVCFVVGALFSGRSPRSPLLEAPVPQFLGKISYSLYLTHWLVLEMALRQLGFWGVCAAIPLCFPIAWLVWWAVERPSIAASRRVKFWLAADMAQSQTP